MHTITIDKAKKRAWLLWLLGIHGTYTAPGTWNELSRSQLLTVAKVLFTTDNIYATKLKLIKALTGLPWITFLPAWGGKLPNRDPDLTSRHFYFISDDDMFALTQQVDWALQDSITLTKNLLPNYRRLYGPRDNFKSVTVGEFFFADPLFHKYMTDQQSRDLDFLCAILYREKKPRGEINDKAFNGDVRNRFNKHLIEYRLPNIKKWPAEVKQAILLYYYGCRAALVEKFNERIFTSGGDGDAIPTIYPMISAYSTKWGTIHDAMHVEIWDFLIEVDAQIEAIEKLKPKT